MKTYKLGVLGLGEGRSILSAAIGSPRWEVSCLCDLNESLCRERCREFQLHEFTTSYEEMLRRSDIDAIGIFTPDPVHAEHMLAGLAAGKHIICTKPIVDNLKRAADLVAAQKASRRSVLVGHSYRFFHTFQRQREDFLAGVCGPLVSVEACYNGDKRKGSAGARGKRGEVNWLYSGLGHAVDLAFWYLGEIEEVHGYSLLSEAGRGLGSLTDDCFQVIMKAKSGTLGHAMGIYGAPRAHPQAAPVTGCTLRGNHGTTTATCPTFDYFTAIDGRPPTRETYIDDGGYYFRWGGSGYHAGEFQNYLEHFALCLDTGQRPSPDLCEGLYVVAVLEAVERSLREGRPVRVEAILAKYGLSDLIEFRGGSPLR